MGGILGKGSNAKTPTTVGSLQFQTSQQGGVIPLVYGTTRVAGNLLDYDDFKSSTPTTGGGGKGGIGGGGKHGGTQTTTYSASFVMGLCHGPIAGTSYVWADKSIFGGTSALSGVDSTNLGADGQAVDPFWLANHPTKAIGYSGTANFACANYQLGSTATLPNFSVEITGFKSGINGSDANPAQIVTDVLTNSRYGAAFPVANLDPGISSGAGSYQNYCDAASIWLSPHMDVQQEAQQALADIVKITNSAIVWSGGLLKIVPYGDLPLTTTYRLAAIGASGVAGDTISLTFTNAALAGSPLTISITTTANDRTSSMVAGDLAQAVNASVALLALGVVAGVGVGRTVISMRNMTAQATTITASATGGTTISLGAVIGPYVFTPNTTPIYSLGEDDFIIQESGVGLNSGVSPGGPALRSSGAPVTGGFSADPLRVVRSPAADAHNHIQLQCKDRGNSYNSHIVETFDQAAVDLYGIRRETSIKGDAIVDPYLTGGIVATLILQRALLYRNSYSFKLGWKYCLLEPMDLIQITDVRLGAYALTVRITAIEEDEEGTLSITAEDFFGVYNPNVLYPSATLPPQLVPTILGVGGGTATPQPKQGNAGGGYTPNWDAPAGPVNTPLIFEPPAALLSGNLEIWTALSGGPNWGGAQVWISTDGSSYSYVATVTSSAIQGVLTATMGTSGGSPDTIDTCSVDISVSRGALLSVSPAEAAAFRSLCYCEGEFFSYEMATLVSQYHYNLTRLYRGAYGSAIGSHAAGAQFTRLDRAIGRFPYASTLIGQTIYLKFPSANLVGGGAQGLASVPAYTYTVTGSGRASVTITVSGSQTGSATANLVVQRYVFADTVTFPAGLIGSQGTAGVLAAATATYHISKNSTTVGTMVFAAGATTATFAMGSATTYLAGDILTVVAPASPDATLANLAWNFVGSH